ncbi:MAG TPA: thioredoxin domain-containing protein [Phycisphaerales bacterium]|nr:thioredoxin domain-containing protein [Phycisphaerales bacterium]
MNESTATKAKANRLIEESSPYLLQHAYNPVDWYAWSDEAFAAAKREDKPIFLSIGYSTCHWCHVMAHESFENESIAAVMNQFFICIKVDREQRPDVDSVYMTAVQMMTGSGGWPLSVFLTPEGKPFYGGTYFPPEDVYGRPGFKKLLLAIADAWKKDRKTLIESGEKLTASLKQHGESQAGEITKDIPAKAFEVLAGIFDITYGGFGAAPKFPQPMTLTMLLGYWYSNGDEKALEMVEKTLNEMADGGIYDHLGGGFHRYSTDGQWLVPHFEKMLYDQALISRAYVEAYRITKKPRYAKAAKEVFDYVLRDMTSADGGFYSAEDADSQGEEGLFYVWKPEEIEKVLGSKTAKVFNEYYGVTKQGNFEHNSSILHITKSAAEVAKKFKMTPEKFAKVIDESKQKLFEYRAKRIRPGRDDKIISGWNGLMISSLAAGGALMGEEKYINAANNAADFVLTKLRVNGRLMRYYGKGKAVEKGFLDDHAYMIKGLLDLYEATFEVARLVEATELTEQMIDLFADEEGGFFLTGSDGEELLIRDKPGYDGAVPSGNSVAATVLLRLGQMTMDKRFTDEGVKVLNAFSENLGRYPTSLTEMVAAVQYWIGPRQEIVIAGKRGADDTQEMIRTVRAQYMPNAVVLLHEEGQAGKELEAIVKFVEYQKTVDNKATAYLCENYVCKQPVNRIKEFEKLLVAVRHPGSDAEKERDFK